MVPTGCGSIPGFKSRIQLRGTLSKQVTTQRVVFIYHIAQVYLNAMWKNKNDIVVTCLRRYSLSARDSRRFY